MWRTNVGGQLSAGRKSKRLARSGSEHQHYRMMKHHTLKMSRYRAVGARGLSCTKSAFGAMVEPLRQRQTKGAEADMPGLPPPRHIPTLPYLVVARCWRQWPLRGRKSRSRGED